VNSLKQIIKKIDWLQVAKVLIVAVMVLAPVGLAFAQSNPLTRNFQCTDTPGLKCGDTTVNGLIKTVINWMLGIAFGVAVLFLIIGGFWYITSAGNEETAEKGKNTAINAIIGIVIIILSYVIVNVVANLVTSGTNGNGV
jgi:amino acid transporter